MSIENIFVTHLHHTISHFLDHLFILVSFRNVCIIQCLIKDLKFDATSAEVLNFKTRAAGYYPLCPTFSTQVQVLESVA
jgi:hypothetical protein